MADTTAERTYEEWLQQLLEAARQHDCEWLITPSSPTHRKAFEEGLEPDEELSQLMDMAEWRGCGCGGG